MFLYDHTLMGERDAGDSDPSASVGERGAVGSDFGYCIEGEVADGASVCHQSWVRMGLVLRCLLNQQKWAHSPFLPQTMRYSLSKFRGILGLLVPCFLVTLSCPGKKDSVHLS